MTYSTIVAEIAKEQPDLPNFYLINCIFKENIFFQGFLENFVISQGNQSTGEVMRNLAPKQAVRALA